MDKYITYQHKVHNLSTVVDKLNSKHEKTCSVHQLWTLQQNKRLYIMEYVVVSYTHGFLGSSKMYYVYKERRLLYIRFCFLVLRGNII